LPDLPPGVVAQIDAVAGLIREVLGCGAID
jgi:hypothetical protein